MEANTATTPNIMIVNNMQTQEAAPAEEGLGQSPKVKFENTAQKRLTTTGAKTVMA